MAIAIVCFSYPDDIPRKPGLHASQQQFLAMDRVTFVKPLQRAWTPFYPVKIDRRFQHPSRTPFGWWPPITDALPPAPLVWKPAYPDLLRRAVWLRPDHNPRSLFPTTVVFFGWRGGFPDRIFRPFLPVSQQLAWVGGQAARPLPDIGWQGQYPNRIDPPTSLTTATQTGFGQNLDPLPNAPSPDLAWGPWYPTHLLPLQGLSAALQQPNVLEPVRPFTPELSWQGWQPVAVRGLFLPTALRPALSFQPRIIAPDIELRWFTQGADLFRPTRRPVEYVRPVEVPVSPVVWFIDAQDQPIGRFWTSWLIPQEASGPGALISIGSQQGWQAKFPHQFWTTTLPWLPPWVEPILPPGSDAGCTIIGDELVIAPTLAPDYLMASTLADAFVIVPSLASEEYC